MATPRAAIKNFHPFLMARFSPSPQKHAFHGTNLQPFLNGAPRSTAPHIIGLLSNRPFDFALTAKGLDTDVRLGVVCPQPEATVLSAFFGKICQRVRANSKKGCLLDYPGLAQACGLPFAIPQQIDPFWATCPEPSGSSDRERALSRSKNVRSCVERMNSGTSTRLVLVFIPDRWSSLVDYEDEDEEINLHAQIKAYCVQHGVASQFLREKTLAERFDCEVMWWIALSLYVKSMRTPWLPISFAQLHQRRASQNSSAARLLPVAMPVSTWPARSGPQCTPQYWPMA